MKERQRERDETGDVLDPRILLAHPLDNGIASPGDNDRTDHAADEGTYADITDLCGPEIPGRPREDARHDDGRAHVPTSC